MTGFLPHPPPVSPFHSSFNFSSTHSSPTDLGSAVLEYSSPALSAVSDNSSPVLPVRSWDKNKVREWLESIRCGEYHRLFEDNHITGEILLECDQQALKDMGITKVGDRVRIHQSLKALRAKCRGSRIKSLKSLDQQAVSPFSDSRTSSPVETYFARSHKGKSKAYSAPNSASLPQTKPEVKGGILSMEAVKQSSVKFIYTQGQSKTVNISGCFNSESIKKKALKKIAVRDNTDNWTVHVADNELGTTTRQVPDLELVTICHSAERKERYRLMLCAAGTTPSIKQLSKSQQILRDTLAGAYNHGLNPRSKLQHSMSLDQSDHSRDSPITTPTTITATAINPRSVETVADTTSNSSSSKIRGYFGQRPPSEHISLNLPEYFPDASSGVLRETIRNSIRFSKRLSRMSRASNRMSIATLSSAWGIPEDDVPPMPSVQSVLDDSTSEVVSDTATSTIIGTVDAGTIKLEDPSLAILDSNIDLDTSDLPPPIIPARRTTLRRPLSLIPDKTLSKTTNRLSYLNLSNRSMEMLTKESSDINDETAPATEEEEELSDLDQSAPTKWIKGSLIGSGSFGTVYLGMNSLTGELMAVKQVELPTGDEANDKKNSMVDALQREMNLLKDMQHENIVQYLGSNSDESFLNIFLEYVPGGSVAHLLSSYGSFVEPLIRNFVRQILQGLKYLHGRNIIHRDIKGANVLVDNKGGIKISDFGISKKIEARLLTAERNRVSLQGSVYWMAPEVVKQTSYTIKADIWSLGCLVVEMFTGTHPFPQFSQMQAIFKIGTSCAPNIPENCSEEAKDFLKRTFELDFNKRPTAEELLEHPFTEHRDE